MPQQPIMVSRFAGGLVRGGSGGGGGGGTLIETVTAQNFSGAARTNPVVSFRRFFVQGVVPAGSFVEASYVSSGAIANQQGDALTYHTDGSLRAATFTFKPPTGSVADNGTFNVDLYSKVGSFDTSTSIARSTLTAQDYKMRIRIAGVDYYCLLNNLDGAATFKQTRVGPAIRGWRYWGVFRNGQGSGDTDQGQLQGCFYAYVLADGSQIVWPVAYNGRISAGNVIAVEEAEFLNGSTSLQLWSTPFSFYAHNAVDFAPSGLPYWSANDTHIHVNVSSSYLHNSLLWWNIYANATQVAAIGSGSALAYTPNAAGDVVGPINAGGASGWIGEVMTWTGLALLSNNKTRLLNDRINAMAQNVMAANTWFINATSGYPPVINNTDYTGSGLSAAQPSIGWGAAGTISDSGGNVSGSAADSSHQPAYCHLQAVGPGWEWWQDRIVMQCVGSLGNDNPGTDTYARNPNINSTQYYGACANRDTSREHAWGMRYVGIAAWTTPADHPCYQYMQDLNTATWAVVAEKMTPPYAAAGLATLSLYWGDEGAATGIAVAPWMQNYRALMIMLAYARGYISSSHKAYEHVVGWILGAFNACPYQIATMDRIAYLQGSQPAGTQPLVTAFSQVYGGDDGGADPATGCARKLISDSGGTSGSCPSSGLSASGEQYAAGHTRPTIYQCVAEVAYGLGITGGSSARSYMATYEAGLGIAPADWNVAPQWQIRWP